MIDLVVLILSIVHKFFQLLAKQMNLTKVKRAKISEKWLINQIVVNAEIEGMLTRFGWVLIADPVESTWNDFNGLVRLGVSLTIRILSVRLNHD